MLEKLRSVHFPCLPRPLLVVIAALYAAASITYSMLWMIDARAVPNQPSVELGFGTDYVVAEHAQIVNNVYYGSPAEQAGLRAGDRILSIDGHPMQDENSLGNEWRRHAPGDTVHLRVVRSNPESEVVLTGVLRARQLPSGEGRLANLAGEVRSSFPVPFILVGVVVLFLHIDAPMVWLLALLFGSFAATPGLANELSSAPAFRSFALTYQSIAVSLLGPLFYTFFTVFPVRSVIDRQMPWLKYLSFPVGLSLTLTGLGNGGIFLPPPFHELVGRYASSKIAFTIMVLLIALGLLCLVLNFVQAPDNEVKRKIRVILWGAGVGVAPALVRAVAENFLGLRTPPWLATVFVILLFFFPLSIAYAVVKHRVLEIPVLLKRSARYLLVQRGFTVLLAFVSMGLVFSFSLYLSQYLGPLVQFHLPLAIATGSGFGVALLWGGTQVHRRVSTRIDRAFFRSVYDAQVILEKLAEQSATVRDRRELAHLMDRSLSEALHPRSLVIYLRRSDDQLECVAGSAPVELQTISLSEPLLLDLTESAKPLDVLPQSGQNASPSRPLAPLSPECVVPMITHGTRLAGLLVLGPRLSEEPYSREDKRLLISVATQAATAWENIRLAEEIVQRKEAERRVVQEMEISQRLLEADNERKTKELEEARTLQLSMLPSTIPEIEGLEIVVRMKTATEVGGDYYDFAVSPDGTLTVALGDATGHGAKAGTMVVAAKSLFIAFSNTPNLLDIFERFTGSIRQLNMRSMYMSLMLLRISESKAVVASAGMPPLLVYRAASRTVEQFTVKGMPLGAFLNFPYQQREFVLSGGDTVIMMSDGFPEMFNKDREMFGYEQVRYLIQTLGGLSAKEIIDELSRKSEEWLGTKPQDDDQTFVVLRVRQSEEIGRQP
jgi:serine phosphatase RsbU (regulator of sigma subunit)/membrane-associated protease RseP (regulator of RpoE activity)